MMQTAETIRSQIHKTVLMCAAARNFGAYEDEKVFMVSNLKLVILQNISLLLLDTLNGADLYDIESKY